MTDTGVDYAWQQPNLDELWAAGYKFVSRYLSYDTTGKNLTLAELQALRAKGFEVSANWEWYGDWTHDYSGGAATGTQHGNDSLTQAEALGYPIGCTIYHSVDFDPTTQQLQTGVHDYAGAYRDRMHSAGLRAGAYGGFHTIKYLFDNGLIDDGWQTYAWSFFSDNPGVTPAYLHWDLRAMMRQDQNGIIVAGATVDHNTRIGPTYLMGGSQEANMGWQFMRYGDHGDSIRYLQQQLRAAGQAIEVTATYDDATVQAVLALNLVGGDTTGKTVGDTEQIRLDLAVIAKNAPAGTAGGIKPGETVTITGPITVTAALAATEE